MRRESLAPGRLAREGAAGRGPRRAPKGLAIFLFTAALLGGGSGCWAQEESGAWGLNGAFAEGALAGGALPGIVMPDATAAQTLQPFQTSSLFLQLPSFMLLAQEDSPKTQPRPPSRAWRAFIVGVGSFPFTFFYTNFSFDSFYFVYNGFDAAYAPWPFKSQYSVAPDTPEVFIRLGVSVGLSALIGILGAITWR